MPGSIGSVLSSVGHWLLQVVGPIIGHAEEHLNLDDALPPPKWYMQQVDSGRLWRGAEPRGRRWDRWEEVRRRGMRSVVSLQAEEPSEACEATPYGIATLRVPITDNHPPTRGQICEVLDFVTNPAHQPAYVHCRAGKGRTGVMVACYRIAVQGYNAAAAIAEAKAFGLAMDSQAAAIRDFAAALESGAVPRYDAVAARNPPRQRTRQI